MSRIIAGTAGGRRLLTPPGERTRPTSDRVREALFARLEHLGAIDDAVVLDLYAGSGALGLEALSRGAAAAVFVERDRKAAGVVRRNAHGLGLRPVQVHAESVETFLGAGADRTAHLVFCDPPYAVTDEALNDVLARLVDQGWLHEEAVIVVERSTRSDEPVWPAGVELLGPRVYGETTLWLAEYVPEGVPA